MQKLQQLRALSIKVKEVQKSQIAVNEYKKWINDIESNTGPSSIFNNWTFARNYERQLKKINKITQRAQEIAERDSPAIQKHEEAKR